jgi:energy-coupling factor transport system ATP-binding protein
MSLRVAPAKTRQTKQSQNGVSLWGLIRQNKNGDRGKHGLPHTPYFPCRKKFTATAALCITYPKKSDIISSEFMEAIKFTGVGYKYKTYQNPQEADPFRAAEEEEYAVRDLSFSVEEGEFVAVLGRNGSGKSTAAKLCNGLLLPESGSVQIFGDDTSDGAKLFSIRKSIGMVFQNPDNQMIATIVEDDIAFGPENIGVDPEEISLRVDFALKSVDMEGYRNSSAARLSGGQKQRIAIAGVLALKPKILVLDESTAMLDPVGRKEVLSVVKRLNREQNITVLLITHFMEEAAECDRLLVLSSGRLALSGSPREVFARYDELKEIGLSVPFSTGVARLLREGGFAVDETIVTDEELIGAICRLLPKN